jgi:hypothetical protein
MNNFLAGLFVIAGILTMGGLFGLLEAHILQDISILYNVPVLSKLKFGQIFGLTICVGLLTYKVGNKKSEEGDYGWGEKLITKLFGVLFIWGFAYLMYNIIS